MSSMFKKRMTNKVNKNNEWIDSFMDVVKQ